MSKFQRTPGPWKVNGFGGIAGPDKKSVGSTGQCKRPAPECAANAHLIAAAPDLLAACETALIDFAEDEKQDARFAVICDMFRDAVAKAKGGAA